MVLQLLQWLLVQPWSLRLVMQLEYGHLAMVVVLWQLEWRSTCL